MSPKISFRVFFRLVEVQDSQMVFDLANDPLTRANSFVSKEISWEDHCEWFNHRLQKVHCPFYIAYDLNNDVVGLVRFDEKRFGEYIMTINLTPEFRGKGLGCVLIKEALIKFRQDFNFDQISAVVKKSNAASIKSFLNAGFIEKGHSLQYGNEAFEFIYRKSHDASQLK